MHLIMEYRGAKVWGWGYLGRSLQRNSPILLANLEDFSSACLVRKPSWFCVKNEKLWAWEDSHLVEGSVEVQLSEAALPQRCAQAAVLGAQLLVVAEGGALCEADLQSPALTFRSLYSALSFKEVACGSEHVLAITVEGVAVSWGKGNKGKLGLGPDILEAAEPTPVKGLEGVQVQQIACGFSHNLVLGRKQSDSVAVYSWGSGADGRLGHGSLEDCYEATEIQALASRSPVVIMAGFLHSIVLTRLGEVLTFGFNGYGQLGLGGMEVVSTPTLCMGLNEHKVVTGQCGAFHTVVACESGLVYSMGLGTKGQLGNGRSVTAQSWPSSVGWRTNEQITRENFTLICGPDSTMLITALQSELGSLSLSVLQINENSTRENSKDSDFPSITQGSDHGFRPENLPPKSREEIEFHRRLVAENNRKYLEKLQEKEREQQQLKARQLAKEEEIREMMKIWVEDILPAWEKKRKLKSTEKLWRRGLPPRVRGEIWLRQLGNAISITPDLYEINVQKAKRLRTNPFDEEAGIGKENSVKLVSQDITRTFNQFGFFREGSPLNSQLRDMLEAFALYRPDIGYVQGMSYLAGILLLNLEPYKAFILLVHVVSSPALIPFYLVDEAGITTRCQLFRILYKHNLPELCDHFETEGIQPKMFLIDWFLTLFARTLSQDVACRVWDLYFLEGFVVLYRTAIALLKLLTYLLLPEDIAGVMQYLNNLSGIIKDADVLVEAMGEVEVPDWVAREIDLLLTATVYY